MFKLLNRKIAISTFLLIFLVRGSFAGNHAGNEVKIPLPLKLSAKVFLEGPFSSGSMTTNLSSQLTGIYGYGGSGTVTMNFLSVKPINAVDVITFSLRSTATSTNSNTVYAWLLSDGSIMDFETGLLNYVSFTAAAGSYYIVVEHRNHLSIMSKNTVALNTITVATFDFTNINNVYAQGAKIVQGTTTCAMYAGDVRKDSKNEVNANDLYDTGKQVYAGPYSNVYSQYDVNLDAQVNGTDWTILLDHNKKLCFSKVP